MTVVPFKRPANAKRPKTLVSSNAGDIVGINAAQELAAVSPKPTRKSRKATLTVSAYGGRKRLDIPIGTGVLTVNGHELVHLDPLVLGTAAAIAGVGVMTMYAKGLPSDGLILSSTKRQRDIENLKDMSVKFFIARFRTGYDIARNGKRHSQWLVERSAQEFWPQAYALVPVELRSMERIEHGVYGENGWPMSAKKIADKAKSKRVIDNFRHQVRSNCEVPDEADFDFSEVLRLTGDSGGKHDNSNAVVLQGRAELKMRQIIARFGFDRLPYSFGELHGIMDYCDSLKVFAGDDFVSADLKAVWQDGSRTLIEQKFPQLLSAFTLYCKGDVDGLHMLHKSDDTLTKLGVDYHEPGDQ